MRSSVIVLPSVWVLLLLLIGEPVTSATESMFEEHLLLRPVSDSAVLMHFHFEVNTFDPNLSEHFVLFPKPVAQIIKRFDVRVCARALSQPFQRSHRSIVNDG